MNDAQFQRLSLRAKEFVVALGKLAENVGEIRAQQVKQTELLKTISARMPAGIPGLRGAAGLTRYIGSTSMPVTFDESRAK